MDINFSQSGQSFALQNQGQNIARVPQKSTENFESTEINQERNGSPNVSLLKADKSEELTSSSTDIATAVAEISNFVQAQNRHLAFSIDENSQRQVVKVTDSESGEVIRQIPSEEVLKLSERIKDLQSDVGAAVGILFNKQV